MTVKILIAIGVICIICAVVFGFYYYNKNVNTSPEPVLKETESSAGVNILFLHHSTGNNIWNGGVKEWYDAYNASQGTNYSIVEQSFPKSSPYGWNNYPYDYWNIWVNHAGNESFKEEPTLEMITEQYDVVIWKHCFPVSNILEDTGNPSVNSDDKRVENYKLQYNALKDKMKEFPDTKFIVWTIASLVESVTSEERALRAKEFYEWVKDEWDEKEDNIYLWDFYYLETEDGLYLKNDFASGSSDSHPNNSFSRTVAPYFCQRIVDVINDKGDLGDITGKT